MERGYKVVPLSGRTERKSAANSKYLHVWQSARVKLKFRLILNSLVRAAVTSDKINKEELQRQNNNLNLFGNETILQSKQFLCFINPDSAFITYWSIFIISTLLYTALFMPFFLAFPELDKNNVADMLDRTLSVIYFIDFIISLNTGFRTNSGALVTSGKKIFIRYLKSWMIIDLIAFFPFEVLFSSEHSANLLFKLVRITRLYKVLKITKLVKWIKVKNNYGMMMKLQDIFGVKHSVLQMIVTCFSILLCVHVISCLWCFSATIYDYGPETWVYRSGYQDEGPFSIYLSSFYWSFTTFSTVGYGDITAGTNLERIISIFWMICSLNFLGFTISTLSSFVNGIDTHDKVLLHKLAIIDEFCAETGLSKIFRLKLRNALRHSSTISRYSLLQQFDILSELPKDLKYEIAKAMHRGAAKTLKFFKCKEDYLIIAIVPYLLPNFVNSGNFVYKCHDFPDEIYFLVKGRVVYVNPENGTGIYTIVKKDYFGDIEVLTKIPRKFSALTRNNCEMLCLAYQIVGKLKKDYPNIYFEMRGVAIERDRVLQMTLKKIKELRKMEKQKSASEMSILKFQTFHRIRREMKKSEIYKKVVKRSIKSQSKVSKQLELIHGKLDSLQQLIHLGTQSINK